jgi:hypothetical protein
MEGNGRGLIFKLLSQHLPRGTGENQEKTSARIAVLRAEI